MYNNPITNNHNSMIEEEVIETPTEDVVDATESVEVVESASDTE